MGYYITMRDSNFCIKAENKADALRAIKNLVGQETITDGGGSHFSWVYTEEFVNADTFADAMESWRWEIEEQQRENRKDVSELTSEDLNWSESPNHDGKDVVGICFIGEKLGDDHVLFQAIAPFVEIGSYIEMSGEEGYIWRWYFDGTDCVEQEGRVVFD